MASSLKICGLDIIQESRLARYATGAPEILSGLRRRSQNLQRLPIVPYIARVVNKTARPHKIGWIRLNGNCVLLWRICRRRHLNARPWSRRLSFRIKPPPPPGDIWCMPADQIVHNVLPIKGWRSSIVFTTKSDPSSPLEHRNSMELAARTEYDVL